MKKKLMLTTIISMMAVLLNIGVPTNYLVHAETATPKSELKQADNLEKIPAQLGKIVDGDTTWFTYQNQSTKVRYLLIDTPEITKKQPYAEKAKLRGEELLRNANVIELQYDKGNQQDKYNRDLMYIWLDGQLLQETLVKEGLARVAYIYQPNTSQLKTLQAAEKQAKKQKIGIWSVKGYATKKGFNPKKYTNNKGVKAKTKKAKKAIKAAEQTPTKENYQLALAALSKIDGGNSTLQKRLNAVNQTIITAEKKAQEQAAAEQARIAQEEAAAEQARIAQELAAAEQARIAQEQAAQSGETQYVDANGNGTIKGSSGGIYHIPGSTYYSRTTSPVAMFKTISEAEQAGYRAPKR